MYELLTNDFKGATITVAITGLPIVITGKVITSKQEGIVSLKAEDGKTINIAENLIAFFF
ncbi:hypothetical protein [Clostridium sp.]|uniref:hypothetical protein n=1 Tax=Clostridium sp. TaxID=1506 RepID=UPI00399568BB